MAVTTTSLGSHSAKLEYPASETLANIIQAIENYITAHGWVLHDSSAGTNKRAYKALNKDGTTYKYLVIDLNTANYMHVTVYEDWNSSTHAGTNMCYGSATVGQAQRIDLSVGGIMYIFAHARWMLALSDLSGAIGSTTGNSWCGCIEVARDNAEDTVAAGYPCWVWTNGSFMMTSTTQPVVCPRRRDGTTGSTAHSFISNGLGMGGKTAVSQAAFYTSVPDDLNNWNSKNWAFTLKTGALDGAFPEVRGRLFGLKCITRNQGTVMDDINIKIDSDFYYDEAGTLTPHTVLIDSVQAGRFAIPQ